MRGRGPRNAREVWAFACVAALALLFALGLADAAFGTDGAVLWAGGSVGGALIARVALATSTRFWRR